MKVLYREPRSALVIGNGAYASSPLANPVNDADAMARLLEQRNFKVTLVKNADLQRMEAAVDLFGQSLGSGGVGLFFYAGHGMQIEGRNYLIPVGARIESERDVKFSAFDVGKVLGKMEDAGNRLNIVFLDACRDNPFARSFRTATTGLAQMDAPSGTLIAYATAPGKVAADGIDSQNSVYTRYLLEQLGVPGQEIGPALRTVRGRFLRDRPLIRIAILPCLPHMSCMPPFREAGLYKGKQWPKGMAMREGERIAMPVRAASVRSTGFSRNPWQGIEQGGGVDAAGQ